VLNGPAKPLRDRVFLKARAFPGSSQQILYVLLQLVQDGAACLVHGLNLLKVRFQPLELFTQLAILIVHGHLSIRVAGLWRLE